MRQFFLMYGLVAACGVGAFGGWWAMAEVGLTQIEKASLFRQDEVNSKAIGKTVSRLSVLEDRLSLVYMEFPQLWDREIWLKTMEATYEDFDLDEYIASNRVQ